MRMTLTEARTKQAELKAAGIETTITIDPSIGWNLQADNRYDPSHPRHHELMICIPVYILKSK